MAADGQCLDQRQLLEAETARNVQFPGWDNKLRAQPAIAMNTKGLVVLATIRVPALTGEASLAINVRLNRAMIARLHVGHAVSHRKNFHAQLMARNAGITVKGHFAEIAGVIRPAYSNSMHTHERFAHAGRARLLDVDAPELLGFLKLNGFHSFTRKFNDREWFGQ